MNSLFLHFLINLITQVVNLICVLLAKNYVSYSIALNLSMFFLTIYLTKNLFVLTSNLLL